VTSRPLRLWISLVSSVCLAAASVRGGDWPSHLGANGAFSDTSGVALVSDIGQAKRVWLSEETGIGFGKAHSGAMGSGYAKGTGLPPSGAASPILAGGLVIQSTT
jgi:hypothetical protein